MLSISRALNLLSSTAFPRSPIALALGVLTTSAMAQSVETPPSGGDAARITAAEAASRNDADRAQSLQRVEVSGQSAVTDRSPGDRQRVTLRPGALPSTVQHVSEEDIAQTNIGRDISNVFRRVPGVLANNIDQGETGNGFRMRGFATQGTHGADTAVSVDGVPQNMPSSQGGAGHGPVFLEWLSADMIEGIDVIKGPISALFGDQNRAGAVDIRTRHGGANHPSSLSVTAERDGLRRASLSLSQSFQGVDSLLVADVYRNDGYRWASQTHRDTLFWKLSTRHGDARYSLRFTRYVADFEAAGYLLLPDLEKGLDPRATQANNPGFGSARRSSLVFNRAPADGEAGWRTTVYLESFDRTRAITGNATQHTVGVDDRFIWGGRLSHNLTWGDQAALVLGAEVRTDRGDASRRIWVNRTPSANYVNAQTLDLMTYGAFAQGQWRLLPTLKASAGARYDRFDYDVRNLKLPAASTGYQRGVFTPKVGLSWSALPTLEWFANVAQGMRSPAAEQISSSGATGPLGASGGVVSAVAPSKVRSYDVGFTASPVPALTTSGSFYEVQNEDEIVGQSDGSFKSVGSTTRRGAEWEARLSLASHTSVYASVGRILEARVNNPASNTGAKLSVPARQWKAGLQHRLGLGSGRLTLNADVYLIEDIPYYQGTPAIQERRMPTYTRYDLRASYDVGPMQVSLYGVLQPHRYGTEIAYGSAAGLMLSPVPRTTIGASLRYFF